MQAEEFAASANSPSGHARHALAFVARGVLLNVHGAQGVQPSNGLVEPLRSVYQPSGQLMLAHALAPSAANLPAAHALQLESGCDAPGGDTQPAGHVDAAHNSEPPALKRPAPHTVQPWPTVAAPTSPGAVCDPEGQDCVTQALEELPPTENLPAEQIAQTPLLSPPNPGGHVNAFS